jgi:hypothetical protein
MKCNVFKYVAQCPSCQLVKAENQRPTVQLQPLKWDQITMSFVVGLPKAPSGQDAIWVIIDRLTKSAHFLPHQDYRFSRQGSRNVHAVTPRFYKKCQ